MVELRPRQNTALEALRLAVAEGQKRILLQAPVGFGKTLLAARYIKERLESGERSIFVAPALSLINQTVERFGEYGLSPVGVMQADHPLTNTSLPVQVASMQTLMRRMIPPASTVFIDEAHMRFRFLKPWMDQPRWQNTTFVGLSATPWAVGMGRDWNSLIVASRLSQMVDEKWLKPLRYFCPIEIDASKVRIVAGDYHEGELSEVSRNRTLLADTVEQWIKLGAGRPTMAFCVDRAHAKDVQARFIECGVKCEYIDAHTEAHERAAIGKRLESGESQVVASVGCLIAGVDWTFISCILFCVKTKSRIKWCQATGRGMRLHPGQTDCLLLDCAGNANLGHPYDIHYATLDDGSKGARAARKKKEETFREAIKCKVCETMRPGNLHTCPACGYTPPPRVATVRELRGALREYRKGADREASGKKPIPATITDPQIWYSSLITIGIGRAYKPGWADVKFKAKFGCWPSDKGARKEPASSPHPIVSSWVRSQDIAWAKSMAPK